MINRIKCFFLGHKELEYIGKDNGDLTMSVYVLNQNCKRCGLFINIDDVDKIKHITYIG